MFWIGLLLGLLLGAAIFHKEAARGDLVGYIVRRIGYGFLTLFVFVTLLFFLVNILIPGDWTSQFILTAEQREALQEQVGLDRSLWEQYWTWIKGLLTFNLGTSFRGWPVATAVKDALATTLFVFVAGMAIAFPLGNWIGRIGAWRGKGWFLGWSSFVAVVFFTAFPPSLAFLLDRGLLNATDPSKHSHIITLDRDLWTLPGRPGGNGVGPTPAVEGEYTPAQVMWRMLLTLLIVLVVLAVAEYFIRKKFRRGIPPLVLLGAFIGVPLLLWRAVGWTDLAFDLLGTILLLTIGVIVLFYGEMQLGTEAAMEDAVDEDFVLTARAKGLDDRSIRNRHAARVALLPVLSRLVVSLPYFLTGLAILESVFEVPGGLGNLVFWSMRNQDTPVVVGTMVVVGAMSLVARLVLDIAYAVIDPRIRYSGSSVEVEGG